MLTTTAINLLLLTITVAWSLPLKKDDGPSGETDNRVLYDQRQEGEWNVRADLKNFVILIIPTSGQGSSTPASPSPAQPSLLDFLASSKNINRRPSLRRNHHQGNQKRVINREEFIESKTAPYHVDLDGGSSESSSTPKIEAQEIVVAKSPSVSFVNLRSAAKNERAFIVTATEKDEPIKKSSGKKVEMKLLGAENEQCGPGLARDSQGICRIIKTN